VDWQEFVSAVAVGLVTLPMAAEAQQTGRVYRLGILRATAPPPADQASRADADDDVLRLSS
jgi:hypothetical protein